ncbi:gamma-glutamylcyclotransferase family protein [Mucisphaera calidilacus]|uniref:AIG2-like family protein n=1 Tax=Mucisphaera calidilacus TaxID=2527982 RepID=A0A518BYD2_9BACT|nr:gamma-glutamylcyclotransferase family protein [Mucisphaera calidilacus]QDU71966.1 AIG2-like family protein [Mucisphaera calidilacus]
MLYFAYGSNLDPQQMDDRCPGFHVHARGCVRDYELTFPRFCEGWAGGVASIAPAEGRDVWGVLYELTQDHLDALDGYESIDEGHYWRDVIGVELDTEQTLEAITYFAHPEAGGPMPPSRQYLDAILRGARYHRLPERYVALLERTPIVPPKSV